MASDLFNEFVERCRADQDRLRDELRSYPPLGVMRVWTGRSVEHLRDITDERIAAIERELVGIEATIELVATLDQALNK
jgi:hypothetical protein